MKKSQYDHPSFITKKQEQASNLSKINKLQKCHLKKVTTVLMPN